MYTVSKEFTFCFGHRLLNDPGKCRHLHGHTAKVRVTLESETLNAQGMVCHFDTIKQTLGRWIEETLDHTLLLSESDPLLTVLRAQGEKVRALPWEPTVENLARMIFEEATRAGLAVSHVEVWESETSLARYERASTK